MRVHRSRLEERLHDRVAGDHRADRGVRRGEPLGGDDEIGPDVVALRAEPGAEAAVGADHLVGAQQDAVAVTDLADALPVSGRRGVRAARVLHRLHDHHRHCLGTRAENRLLEIRQQEAGELLLGLLRRTVVAVRVPDVDRVRDERLERSLQSGDAVDRERSHRRSVVGDPARDRLPAPLAACRVVLAGELPRRLDRLGAAGDEEHPVEIARCEAGDLCRQLDGAGMGVRPVDVERQLSHLRRGRLAHLLAEAVADLDAEEPGERVEIPLAVKILEIAAVPAHDHRHFGILVPTHAGEVEPEVVARGPLQFVRTQSRIGVIHRGHPSACVPPTAAGSRAVPRGSRRSPRRRGQAPPSSGCGLRPRSAPASLRECLPRAGPGRPPG